MTIALALLLDAPPADPDATLHRLCHTALGDGIEWTPHEPPAEFRYTRQFRFRFGTESFLAIAADRAHPETPAIAAQVSDPATRQRIERHGSFLAVALAPGGGTGAPEFAAVYPPMARILAGACDDAAIAVHAPQWDRTVAVDAGTVAALRTAQPLRTLGVLHTNVGCLLAQDGRWVSVYPSPFGPIRIDAAGDAQGPAAADVDRMRRILDHGLRLFRARLAFSLLQRPWRIVLDEQRRISVQFRSSVTGLRSRLVPETDVHG